MEAQVKTIGKPRQYKGEAQVSQRRSPCLTIEAHVLQYILTLTIDHLIEFCLQYQIRDWFWDQIWIGSELHSVGSGMSPMVMSELDLCLIEKCLSLTEELSNPDITVGAKPDYPECN